MKRKQYSQFIILIIFLFAYTGCKKFIQLDAPVSLVTSEFVFSSDQTATASVTGLYSKMMAGTSDFFNGGLSLYPALCADEVTYGSSSNTTAVPFQTNSLVSTDNTISKYWVSPYGIIYHSNACLEGLISSTVITPSVKQQLIGEAKFCRAISYFYLVNLFGDVPLILTTDYRVNATLPRTPVNLIYDQIISDLNDAVNFLPSTYLTTTTLPNARIRPNKWTAASLLARVYLYKKDWQNAEIQASAIINSGMYSLVTNLANVFTTTSNTSSTETIWQLMPTGTSINTAEGFAFNPSSATVIPPYPITSFLLNAFEAGDARKTNWLKTNVVSSVTYYYPNKYKVRTGGSPYTEYNMVIRLAEVYLIRAEALAQQNKLTESAADLNKIRNRAVLPNTTANSLSTLLSAIERERQVELFTEFGHRWFDLKRTDRINAVLSVEKPGWQPTDALWPIPVVELNSNPSLTQNAGY